MSKNQIYIIILKVFGLYLAKICIDHMIDLSSFILSDSTSKEYFYVMLNSKLSSFAIYFILSFLFLSKTKYILKLVFVEKKIEDETIDSSLLINSENTSKRNILQGVIKIIGIIFMAMSIISIGTMLYTMLITYGRFQDSYFILAVFNESVSPLIQYFIGYLLIRSPKWLLNFLKVAE